MNDVLILKKRRVAQEAQQAAQKDFDKLFAAWHPYIDSCRHYVLRELYAAEGIIAYAIRVDFTDFMAPGKEAEIRRWVAEHISSDDSAI